MLILWLFSFIFRTSKLYFWINRLNCYASPLIASPSPDAGVSGRKDWSGWGEERSQRGSAVSGHRQVIYARGCGIGTIIKREAACTASIGPLFTPLGRSAAWAVSLGAPSKFDTRIITLRNAVRRDRSLKYIMC